jgi:S25 ribosomal protein
MFVILVLLPVSLVVIVKATKVVLNVSQGTKFPAKYMFVFNFLSRVKLLFFIFIKIVDTNPCFYPLSASMSTCFGSNYFIFCAYQINGSLARRAIKDLMSRGAIRMVSVHCSQQIYTRATNT